MSATIVCIVADIHLILTSNFLCRFPCRLAGLCYRQSCHRYIITRNPIVRKHTPTHIPRSNYVNRLHEQRDGLAKLRVFTLGYNKRRADMRPQQTLYFFRLYLYSSAVYHIIESSDNAETTPIGQNLGYIARCQRVIAHLWRVNDEATVGIYRNSHRFKRCIPFTCIRAAKSSHGYMRERFRHTVSAPYSIGKRP